MTYGLCLVNINLTTKTNKKQIRLIKEVTTMNKAEFEAWKNETSLSKKQWILDQVHNGENSPQHLFYRGGENGQYVSVLRGHVAIGNYEGAVPHIGEAFFKPLYTKEFDSTKEAFEVLVNKAMLQLAIKPEINF